MASANISSFLTTMDGLDGLDVNAASNSEETTSLDYKTWAILAINVVLLLERAFKTLTTGKFAIKCNGKGCFCGTRTPPQTPIVSQDEESSPDDSPQQKRHHNRGRQLEEATPPSTPHSTPESSVVEFDAPSSDYEEFAEFKRFRDNKRARSKERKDAD